MFRRFFALAVLAGAVGSSFAQGMDNPDWKEQDAPPPPPLRTTGLIPLEVPGSSLRFGVDPASVAVGKDGVVRYVVVAQSSSGAVNGIYEGLSCSGGSVRIYARHNPDSGWVPAGTTLWTPLHQTANSRYSLQVARTGACVGHAPNGNAAQIVRDLRSGVDHRFEKY
ncbi:CNP1-like family protein [Ramlibacter sp. XY19]|uniref:CNP1-like family protein n=1 Tax=Ramlibacter paludis TaxID=2908000 RepID=UPI0023DA85F0|nr:CNP1-like family protein [Ramlibacter paludis]MCG2595294.1 CNP1-like family protein [Ramlibacter paludis]